MAKAMGRHQGANNYWLSMMPIGLRHLNYKDRFVLDDSLDSAVDLQSMEENGYILSEHMKPLKLQFASIIFVVQGKLDLRINLVEYHLKAGNTIVLIPGVIADYVNISPDSHIGTISFSAYDYPFITDNRLVMTTSHDAIRQPLCFKLPDRDLQAWVTLYRQMHDVLSDPDFAYKDDYLDGAMRCFTAIYTDAYSRYKPAKPSNPSRAEAIFLKFMDDVREHYAQHRDLAFYADRQCITPKYLSREVMEASHRHPADWINDYVILDAKAMILSGDYTILEISEALNFPNQSFFGKYFRQAVGCAPSQYRLKT